MSCQVCPWCGGQPEPVTAPNSDGRGAGLDYGMRCLACRRVCYPTISSSPEAAVTNWDQEAKELRRIFQREHLFADRLVPA